MNFILKDPDYYFESNDQNVTIPQREVFISRNLTKAEVQIINDMLIIGMLLCNEQFSVKCFIYSFMKEAVIIYKPVH